MDRISIILLILISLLTFTSGQGLSQSKRTIKGKVMTEKNEPLPGVMIHELGTENGVVTDVDGVFELTVERKDDVFIKLIGLHLEKYVKYTKDEDSKKLTLYSYRISKKESRKSKEVFEEWKSKTKN
ncbi:carboxypeptidase-like regulatory domain-containing protein [Pontibacter sp. KCTC 32443]|uniref:carboxypeptidase-like regulatory domain-containing protein n=1 Tax=Pontibacter TaxID=323449 RepID=UPI00164CF3E1|nr:MULTISPECIES: carboxypeptidase-like regulatory domain-containing protein [Pontibacter]MBC5773589.1 carboxypeptidase-like regulatory domain-containing protein [Pontibacter sp. KCTC 32443]